MKTRSTPPQILFSVREAARALRVSRTGTLAKAIERGLVHVVTINGRVRIPARELERISREGLDVRGF